MVQLTLSIVGIMFHVLDKKTLHSLFVRLLQAFNILSPHSKLLAKCQFAFLRDIDEDKRSSQIVIFNNRKMFEDCLKMFNVIKSRIIRTDSRFQEYYTQEVEDFSKYITCKYLSMDKTKSSNIALLNKCMVILSFKIRPETFLFKQEFKNVTMVIKRLLQILNVSSTEYERMERHILKTVDWAVFTETPFDKFLLLHEHFQSHLKCANANLRQKQGVSLLKSYYRCTAGDTVYIYHHPLLVAMGMLQIAYSDIGHSLFRSKTWREIKDSNRETFEEICRRLRSYSWELELDHKTGT